MSAVGVGRWVDGKWLSPAANARLIDAAPELLAALQQLLQAAQYGGGWQTMDPAKDRARAAIARTEGEP